MMLKLFRAATIAASVVLTASSAGAATLVLDGSGEFTHKVHSFNAGAGNSLTLMTKQSGSSDRYPVVYTANAGATIDAGSGDGYAKVDGPFSSLTIDPSAPLLGFTKIGFNLDPVKALKDKVSLDHDNNPSTKAKKYEPVGSFEILVNFTSGPSETLTTGFGPNTKFDIIAGLNQVITDITIRNLVGTVDTPGQDFSSPFNFASIRQVSFDAVPASVSGVPEPATWAMMIGGFGVMGGMLRRGRKTSALATA